MIPTHQELINIILNSKDINNTLNNLEPFELRADAKQYFYLCVLEIPYEKLLKAYNRCDTCLLAMAGKIIKNQFKSSQSKFYRLYRTKAPVDESKIETFSDDPTTKKKRTYKHINIDFECQETTQELIKKQLEEDYNIQQIKNFLRSINYKNSVLFEEHWLNSLTLKEISVKYNIKYRTVHNIVRETEKLIRNTLTYKEL